MVDVFISYLIICDMAQSSFRIPGGRDITAVTVDELQEVRVAAEDVRLQLLQMMENAGRALAW